MATITLSVEEWQELVKMREAAEAEASKLKTEIASILRGPNDALVSQLVDGMLAAFEVIRGVALTFPPDMVTQPWPYRDLIRFSEVLEQLPLPPIDKANLLSAAMDMRDFAQECEMLVLARAGRIERAHKIVSGEMQTSASVDPEP